MNVIGVDLAWSTGGTGLCAVRDAQVISSTRVRSDDEIIGWLKPHVAGECLVAVDAPLIVVNETGRRPCERAVSKVFGRYHASAHSSNLSRPGFADGARAGRLALQLGLDIDPSWETGAHLRRIIEVYPHPALVTLFDLPLTLKYKAKKGRVPTSRHPAFEQFIRYLESLTAADPPLDVATSQRWLELVQSATTSESGAELDRVEDELDAYLCAYIGLYYLRHGSNRCWVAGDSETGYVVIPVAGACPGSPMHPAAGAVSELAASRVASI